MQPVRKFDEDEQGIAWEAAVSAWVDGEEAVRAEELDSPYGRQIWDTYHLIGDVLRTPDLARRPSDMFYARLAHAIDEEAPLRAQSHPRRRWWAGVSGLALAAGTAAVVWLMPPLSPEGGAPDAGQAAPQLAAADEEASEDADAGLHDYLAAHQGFAGAVPLRQVSWGSGARR